MGKRQKWDLQISPRRRRRRRRRRRQAQADYYSN